jgi:hypothetical protein
VPVTTTSGQPSTAVSPDVAVSPMSASGLAALRTAPFYYSRTLTDSSGHQSTQRNWQGRTARGRIDDTLSAIPPLSTSARAPSGDPMTWADFSTVTDPARIKKWLYPSTAIPYSVEAARKTAFQFSFTMIGDKPTSPAYVAAVFDQLRLIPGVTMTAGVTDSAGRPGVSLLWGNSRFIYSPDHGRLLEEDSLPDGGCDRTPRTGWNRTLYLEAGPVPDNSTTLPEEHTPRQPPADLCPSP